MADLWQITFSIPDQADMITEMIDAAFACEGFSIHRDADDDPLSVMMITDHEPDESRLSAVLAEACEIAGQPSTTADISRLPARDWLAENRKSFPPLDIGRFWIYGAYVDQSPPEGKIGLKIEAGQAFGSGTHATTYGCIMMLEKYCPDKPGQSIADIGCGSGILAMAAAKIRPDAVIIAVDNDPISVDTAHDNAVENSVSQLIQCGISDGYKADLVQENAPYDVILANILPSPLIDMAQDAVRCLADEGVLIMSGLLDDQQQQVIEAYEALGLKLMDHMVHNGWATLVMGRG